MKSFGCLQRERANANRSSIRFLVLRFPYQLNPKAEIKYGDNAIDWLHYLKGMV